MKDWIIKKLGGKLDDGVPNIFSTEGVDLTKNLTKEDVAMLRVLMESVKDDKSNTFLRFIDRIFQIEEAMYTEKAIHTDCDEETRKTYMVMARLSRNTPRLLTKIINTQILTLDECKDGDNNTVDDTKPGH